MKKVAIFIVGFSISCKVRPARTDSSQVKEFPKLQVAYPEIDFQLGERKQENEESFAVLIASTLKEQMSKRYGDARMLRDGHPKSHGCLSGHYEAKNDVPTGLAFGVFTPGSKYKATVRFSNADPDPMRHDLEGDVRGMAIKLHSVEGPKLLETRYADKEQDFLLVNSPKFFLNSVSTYLDLVKNLGTSSVFQDIRSAKILGWEGSTIGMDIQKIQVASPLQTTYFSMTSYQLGKGDSRKASRLRAVPCSINLTQKLPESNSSPNDYLRESILKHFAGKKDACFEIQVQLKTKPEMDVENPMNDWIESPWHSVGWLRFFYKEQRLPLTAKLNDDQNLLCDNLSFNPWNSLEEHKPLGAINRIRKFIYSDISSFRKSRNRK